MIGRRLQRPVRRGGALWRGARWVLVSPWRLFVVVVLVRVAMEHGL